MRYVGTGQGVNKATMWQGVSNMTKLECALVAVVIIVGVIIGLALWQSAAGNIDLSAWAEWFMTPGNDLLDLVAYYLGN